MTTTTPPLQQRLEAILPELIELRRHLHAHPELSGEEHQTAALFPESCVSAAGVFVKGWGAPV